MFERSRVLLALRRRQPRGNAWRESTDPIKQPIPVPKRPSSAAPAGAGRRRPDRGWRPRASHGSDFFDYLLGFLIVGLVSLGGMLLTSNNAKKSPGTGWQLPSPPSWTRSGPALTIESGSQSPRRKKHQRGVNDIPTPDTLPAPTLIVPATYTDLALHAGFHGKVFVIVIVDEMGVPEKIEPTGPIPFGLELPIGEAVLQWRFQPAMLMGEPVPGKTVVEVPFR